MNRPSDRDIVITGLGVVSPLGSDLATVTERLLSGSSGAGKITNFVADYLPTTIAAETRDFVNTDGYRDRKISFALAAARSAVADAGEGATPLKAYYATGGGRLSMGIGLELFAMEDMLEYRKQEQSGATDAIYADPAVALTFLQTPSDICVHLLSREHELNLPPLTHISACAASTDAIGCAFRSLREGTSHWLLVGGTDSMINPLGVGGFCRLQALTTRNDDPKSASRPFDRGRDGFLLGEGAAMLVLETRTHAKRRGARIYGQLCGYGNSFDAHGISEPHPQGEGALLAMQRALQDAAVGVADVACINAHGTSTPKNDVVETLAIKRLLGPRAGQVPVNATKSMCGHLISAAGAFELAAALLCAQRAKLHPTINLTHPDPHCDLDYVSEGARDWQGGYLLKNSFGFGGQNASLVLRIGG